MYVYLYVYGCQTMITDPQGTPYARIQTHLLNHQPPQNKNNSKPHHTKPHQRHGARARLRAPEPETGRPSGPGGGLCGRGPLGDAGACVNRLGRWIRWIMMHAVRITDVHTYTSPPPRPQTGDHRPRLRRRRLPRPLPLVGPHRRVRSSGSIPLSLHADAAAPNCPPIGPGGAGAGGGQGQGGDGEREGEREREAKEEEGLRGAAGWATAARARWSGGQEGGGKGRTEAEGAGAAAGAGGGSLGSAFAFDGCGPSPGCVGGGGVEPAGEVGECGCVRVVDHFNDWVACVSAVCALCWAGPNQNNPTNITHAYYYQNKNNDHTRHRARVLAACSKLKTTLSANRRAEATLDCLLEGGGDACLTCALSFGFVVLYVCTHVGRSIGWSMDGWRSQPTHYLFTNQTQPQSTTGSPAPRPRGHGGPKSRAFVPSAPAPSDARGRAPLPLPPPLLLPGCVVTTR